MGTALYRIELGKYFYLTKFGGENNSVSGPFLSGIFFAPDDGTILRATARNVEADTGSKLIFPAGLLPNDVKHDYTSILMWLKSMKPKVCQEVGVYRIASDGLFIHRMIETEKFTFYFRGREDNRSENPYGVLYKY